MHKRFRRFKQVNRVALLAAASVFIVSAAGCSNFYLEQYHDSNSDYGSVRATRSDSESGVRSDSETGTGRTFGRTRLFRLTDAADKGSQAQSRAGLQAGSDVGSKAGSKMRSETGLKASSKTGSLTGSKVGSKTGLRERSRSGPSPAGSRAAGADFHRNERLFISEQAMYQLDKIQGIAAAVVIITDRNAYVGVITDQSSTGTYMYGGSPDVNNAGTSEGVYDIYTGRTYAGNRKTAPRLLATRTNNLHTVSGSEKLSPKLTQNIESAVRSMHPHVQRVFVSPNRDYVNFLNSFATDYWNGRRLDNRLEQFNRTIHSFGHIWS